MQKTKIIPVRDVKHLKEIAANPPGVEAFIEVGTTRFWKRITFNGTYFHIDHLHDGFTPQRVKPKNLHLAGNILDAIMTESFFAEVQS